MPAIETLESVAALLPPDRRERFLGMVARFRSVPEDDEYLQVLEAIGFMSLLWHEVPKDIERILEGASPVSETCHGVAGTVRDAVVAAIPSYEDLKRITGRLEAHELALKNTLATRARGAPSERLGLWPLSIFLVGMTVGLLIHELLFPLLS